MWKDTPPTQQWGADHPNPGRDLALAVQAVEYLRGHGFDDGAVVQCLRDEFEIDLATAEKIAGPQDSGPQHGEAVAG